MLIFGASIDWSNIGMRHKLKGHKCKASCMQLQLALTRFMSLMGTFIPAPKAALLLLYIHPPSPSACTQGPVAAALHVIPQSFAPAHPACLHPPHPFLTAACVHHTTLHRLHCAWVICASVQYLTHHSASLLVIAALPKLLGCQQRVSAMCVAQCLLPFKGADVKC